MLPSVQRKWRVAYRRQDLKHTCVSWLVEQGADVAVVQAVARHANAAVTGGRLHALCATGESPSRPSNSIRQ